MVTACCNLAMDDVAEIRRRNLAALVAKWGLTSVAKRVKRSSTQISDTLAKRKSFGEKVARAMEREWDPSCKPGWLDVDRPAVDHNVEPGPDLAARPVPLISWVQAGDWCEVTGDIPPGDAEEWLVITGHSRPRAFALRVRGVSMEPRYQDGDIILVDPDRQAINGSHVVVRLDNENEATFKQLVIEGERKFLQPLNPRWPDQLIEINGNATICGVVFAMHRDV